jgi:hypothetical protein
MERIKESRPDFVQNNMVLSQLALNAKDNYRYISETEPHRIISSQDIKDILAARQIKHIILLEVFREHNEKMKGLVEQDFFAATL